MSRRGECKCQGCGEFYVPDARNRGRQRYCAKPECKKASKVASQEAWLGKPDNRDHFRGPENVERVKAWRAGNPGYWRRRRVKRADALQETLNLEYADDQPEKPKRAAPALQDILKSQDPLVLGLVIHLADTALQEDIVGMTQRLITKGRAMMGERPGGPTYDKQDRDGGTGAARAVAV